MLHLKAVATSTLDCVWSKNFLSIVEKIAAANTWVAVFLLHSCRAGESGLGRTFVFMESMIDLWPRGVAADGGGSAGATTVKSYLVVPRSVSLVLLLP